MENVVAGAGGALDLLGGASASDNTGTSSVLERVAEASPAFWGEASGADQAAMQLAGVEPVPLGGGGGHQQRGGAPVPMEGYLLPGAGGHGHGPANVLPGTVLDMSPLLPSEEREREGARARER